MKYYGKNFFFFNGTSLKHDELSFDAGYLILAGGVCNSANVAKLNKERPETQKHVALLI